MLACILNLFRKKSKNEDFDKVLADKLSFMSEGVLKSTEEHPYDQKEFGRLILREKTLKEELTKEEISALEEALKKKQETTPHAAFTTPLPDEAIKESDGSGVLDLDNVEFRNWGETVSIRAPSKTCFPQTKVGVQNCVRWAKSHGKRVRAAGYRHTWSDLYCEENDVLISMLPLNVAEKIPTPKYPYDPDHELISIYEVNGSTDPNHQWVRVGPATSNEHLRQWTQENGLKWTIPLNTVIVELTFGGSNAPICHGAGLRHQTLSDIVMEMEYVNANGDLRIIKDKDLLKSAAGCFGLLGIVVSLTLRLDKMTYASMRPRAKPVTLTIPPPEGYQIPHNINTKYPEDEKNSAWNEFVQNCETAYYAEYFWFPLQEECWINCWDNDGHPQNSVTYPTPKDIKFQAIGLTLLNFAHDTICNVLPAHLQALIFGNLSMGGLRSGDDYVVPVSEGLHFARGIQNLRCWDMEWEIPIPALADDATKPDWTVVQKCWWDVIIAVYKRYNENKHDVPMRLALEMRIMGGSNIVLSPQYGNELGTCSIEMLSFDTVSADEWQAFMQEITDAWSKYTDAGGQPLKIRPHWAKQWKNLTVRGRPINDYMRDVYKTNIKTFKADLEKIGKPDGITVENMRALFSDNLIDQIIFNP